VYFSQLITCLMDNRVNNKLASLSYMKSSMKNVINTFIQKKLLLIYVDPIE
jgi:hypothetical protein